MTPDRDDDLPAELARLRDELDKTRRQRDGFVDLLYTAVSHHMSKHPDCEGYRP